jgi:5'-nucleotidase
MHLPHVLITNDDGVRSHFLRALVEAHLPHFRISVVAPRSEQSWIGRAFSRLRDVEARRVEDVIPGCETWAVDGTPSDCVNIALGNLLTTRPDVVISGINIGFNISMPLSLSSGTLAGAIEGAAWGLPALAYSLDLPDEAYLAAQRNHGQVSGTTAESLVHAATHATRFTLAQLGQKPRRVLVHNINFPRICTAQTPVERTSVGDVRLGSLFQQQSPGIYRFKWIKRDPDIPYPSDFDAACMLRGHISHSILDYSAVGDLRPTT